MDSQDSQARLSDRLKALKEKEKEPEKKGAGARDQCYKTFFAILGDRWIVAGSVANHIKPLRS